jgi:hypothetical protein
MDSITADGCLSAHYENTDLITDVEPENPDWRRKQWMKIVRATAGRDKGRLFCLGRTGDRFLLADAAR